MAIKIKDAAGAATAPKLFDQVGQYWDARHTNGQVGLALLDQCIRRAASKNRDWDALARFVTRAGNSGNRAKVVKIVRAAFGDKLTYKADAKHPAGGVFTMDWTGAFPLKESNAYTSVTKAIADSKSWDDRDFLKALSEVIPAKAKPPVVADAKATEKAAKHLTDYILAKVKEGFKAGEIMAMVQANLKAQTVKG